MAAPEQQFDTVLSRQTLANTKRSIEAGHDWTGEELRAGILGLLDHIEAMDALLLDLHGAASDVVNGREPEDMDRLSAAYMRVEKSGVLHDETSSRPCMVCGRDGNRWTAMCDDCLAVSQSPEGQARREAWHAACYVDTPHPVMRQWHRRRIAEIASEQGEVWHEA